MIDTQHELPDALPLVAALEEWRAAFDDVNRAEWQDVTGPMKRLARLVAPSTPIGDVLDRTLPPVDFATWHAAATASVRGLGGGDLNWPLDTSERLAIQRELLRHLSADHQAIHEFILQFTYRGKSLSGNLHAFVEKVLQPFQRDLLRTLRPAVAAERQRATASAAPQGPAPHTSVSDTRIHQLVSPERIEQLRVLSDAQFNFSRLVRLCEEANIASANECYFSVALLVRAILDHVPPIFGQPNFKSVVSQHPGQSSRDSLRFLEEFSRKIADGHLHTPIRSAEVLPNWVQVDCSAPLDHLLAEIIRLRMVAMSSHSTDGNPDGHSESPAA